jgi:hypothetical protein
MKNYLFDSFRIATVSVTLTAMPTLVLPSQALAEVKEIKRAREEVAAACEAAGGVGYGYEASSGGYGCATDVAWISCDEDGNCEGEVHGEDETAKGASEALNRWARVSRLKLDLAAGADSLSCRLCSNIASKIRQLDATSAAAVREIKLLRRSAKLGRAATLNQARAIHRRLEELGKKLGQNTVRRQQLIADYRYRSREAKKSHRPRGSRPMNKTDVRAHSRTTRSAPIDLRQKAAGSNRLPR